MNPERTFKGMNLTPRSHITGAECSPLARLQSRDDAVQDVECLGVSPEHHAASHHVHAEDGDDREDSNKDEDSD